MASDVSRLFLWDTIVFLTGTFISNPPQHAGTYHTFTEITTLEFNDADN